LRFVGCKYSALDGALAASPSTKLGWSRPITAMRQNQGGEYRPRRAIPGKVASFCTVYGIHCLDLRQKKGRETAGKARKRKKEAKKSKKYTAGGHF
jgi:hypothetical protein